MSKRIRYTPEVKERMVWMLLEHQDEHPSQWRAICFIAAKLGRAGPGRKGGQPGGVSGAAG